MGQGSGSGKVRSIGGAKRLLGRMRTAAGVKPSRSQKTVMAAMKKLIANKRLTSKEKRALANQADQRAIARSGKPVPKTAAAARRASGKKKR